MSLVKRQRLDSSNSGALIGTKNGGNITTSEGVVLDPNTGGSILSGSFNNDGSLIATAGTDKFINIWNFTTVEYPIENILSISGHKSAITSLKWSSDSLMIFTSSADRTIGIWDTETGQRLRKLKGHQLVVNELCVFEENRNQFLASCSDDGNVFLWDAREKTHVKEFKTEYPMLTCTMNHANNMIYTSGIDPVVYALDILNFEKPVWTSEIHKDYVTSLSISLDDQILVSRSNDGTVRSYNSKSFVQNQASRARPGIYDGSISNYDNVIRCVLSGNYLISGSDDKHLTVWDFNSRKLLKKLGGHKGSVLDVDIHPNLRTVLSTSSDGTCIIRNI